MNDEQLEQHYWAAVKLYLSANGDPNAKFELYKAINSPIVVEEWASKTVSQPTADQLKQFTTSECDAFMKKNNQMRSLRKNAADKFQEDWEWSGPWEANETTRVSLTMNSGVVSLVTGAIAPASTKISSIESVTVVPEHLRPAADMYWPVVVHGSPTIGLGYAKLEAATGKMYVHADGNKAPFPLGKARAGPTNLNLQWAV